MHSLFCRSFAFLSLVLFSYSFAFASSATTNDDDDGQEFQIFDGRTYNGKYYPRVDAIEWESNMEFHVFSKNDPVDITFELEDRKDSKKIMLLNYHIKSRGERLCRRIPAPEGFKKGFHVYRDNSDPEFDNIIVSMNPIAPKAEWADITSNAATYASCAAPKPASPVAHSSERLPAVSGSGSAPFNIAPSPTPASGTTPTPAIHEANTPATGPGYKLPSKEGTVRSATGGAAFSDW